MTRWNQVFSRGDMRCNALRCSAVRFGVGVGKGGAGLVLLSTVLLPWLWDGGHGTDTLDSSPNSLHTHVLQEASEKQRRAMLDDICDIMLRGSWQLVRRLCIIASHPHFPLPRIYPLVYVRLC